MFKFDSALTKFVFSGRHFLVRDRAVRADRAGGGGPRPTAQDGLLRRRLPRLQQPPRRPGGEEELKPDIRFNQACNISLTSSLPARTY